MSSKESKKSFTKQSKCWKISRNVFRHIKHMVRYLLQVQGPEQTSISSLKAGIRKYSILPRRLPNCHTSPINQVFYMDCGFLPKSY